MQIGRKIYYELATGNVILNTGERSGDVAETTREQDFATYVALAERVPDTVGLLELDYGQYAQDFADCSGYRVNADSGELEFSYPDTDDSTPETPVYQTPLSQQVADLEARTEANEAAILALLDFGL